MQNTVINEIALRLSAIKTCEVRGNTDWLAKHSAVLDRIERTLLPRGAGIDCGTKIDRESDPEKILLTLSFHHMHDGGSDDSGSDDSGAYSGTYDGWTEHTAVITASLLHGLNLRITGLNRNDIKDYLHECLEQALTERIPVDFFKE